MERYRRQIIRCSLLMAALAGMLFPACAAGIWIGCLGGLIGFFMICAMAERLCADTSPAAVFAHYVLRWLFYGALLLSAMQGGIHPLWVLAGLLAHKLSILICVMKER